MNVVRLELTDEQASVVATACESYARVRMGQFQEIYRKCLSVKDVDDYCVRRDNAERELLNARKYIYPDLHGLGHSYGIGKFKDADQAFDIYQVIRVLFGDERPPFSFWELPKAERITE